MGTGGEASNRAALMAAVLAALRQQSRRSVHPSDQAALSRAAAGIAEAVEADFLVRARHELSAELTDHSQLSAIAHE